MPCARRAGSAMVAGPERGAAFPPGPVRRCSTRRMCCRKAMATITMSAWWCRPCQLRPLAAVAQDAVRNDGGFARDCDGGLLGADPPGADRGGGRDPADGPPADPRPRGSRARAPPPPAAPPRQAGAHRHRRERGEEPLRAGVPPSPSCSRSPPDPVPVASIRGLRRTSQQNRPSPRRRPAGMPTTARGAWER